jgi:hypothetical protein
VASTSLRRAKCTPSANWELITAIALPVVYSSGGGPSLLGCPVHMLTKEEKFLKGYTHKAAQVSRIHAYLEDLEG